MFKLLALERKSTSHDKNKQQQVHTQIKNNEEEKEKDKTRQKEPLNKISSIFLVLPSLSSSILQKILLFFN
jgi:hypothetical protein